MNTICTSACGNDYDCPHEEQFDEVKLKVQHLPSDYPPSDELIQKVIENWADQEQKYGEQRLADNEN